MAKPTIHSLSTLSKVLTPRSRLLCLYSGGLDGTYLLHHLSTQGCAEIVALTVDLGGDLDREQVERLCRRLGVRWVLLDKSEEFAQKFVIPAIAAQATYLGGHPISASLSRPLMAKVACEVAQDPEYNCDMIVHTSNRSQNSLRRFNGALASKGFQGDFGSPFEFSPIPREVKRRELREAGIEMVEGRVHSSDSNFWGREFESGDLDDPEVLSIPEFLYQWTTSDAKASQKECVSITFSRGIPVQLNGRDMGFLALVHELNLLAGAYGVGRYTGLEEIEGGAKVQEVREMPAATVLLDAYRRLESASLSAENIREKMHIEQMWVREAIEGRWFDPLREAAQAFIHSMAQAVTGTVAYELQLRKLQPTSVKAEQPLYIRDRGLFEEGFGESEPAHYTGSMFVR